MRRARSSAAPSPAARDLVSLADADFILEPDLYLGARGLPACDLRQQVGKVFFNASAARPIERAWIITETEPVRQSKRPYAFHPPANPTHSSALFIALTA